MECDTADAPADDASFDVRHIMNVDDKHNNLCKIPGVSFELY